MTIDEPQGADTKPEMWGEQWDEAEYFNSRINLSYRIWSLVFRHHSYRRNRGYFLFKEKNQRFISFFLDSMMQMSYKIFVLRSLPARSSLNYHDTADCSAGAKWDTRLTRGKRKRKKKKKRERQNSTLRAKPNAKQMCSHDQVVPRNASSTYPQCREFVRDETSLQVQLFQIQTRKRRRPWQICNQVLYM